MKVTLAATQMACSWDMEENLATAERLVRKAAAMGANVILLQEMFATHFFAFMDWKAAYFKFASPAAGNPILQRMAALARELGVVLPVNFFERANNAYFNTIMVIDDQGRSYHIPKNPPPPGIRVRKREDDQPEIVRKRYHEYTRDIRPIADLYRRQGTLVPIDAVGSIGAVLDQLLHRLAENGSEKASR